jgi:hypothetical protein
MKGATQRNRGTAHRSLDEGEEAARWHGRDREEDGTSQWCGSIPSGWGSFYRARGGALGQ